LTFGHSGAMTYLGGLGHVLSARVPKCQKIEIGGLDQYGPKLFNV